MAHREKLLDLIALGKCEVSYIAFTLSSSYIKQETSGKSHFLTKDHSLNFLGGGTLGDVTYLCQISRLYDKLFQTRIFSLY